ncbi:MAG: DUF2283 domain-containing protein [Parcubacteria group bacterium]|nr:DUF2283 domain-containing protein [Parcubacteria group bacterium]
MKIIYDPYADALNITFKEGKVKKTLEIAPEIILDVDSKLRPLHLEILGVKEKLGKENTEEIIMRNLVLDKTTAKTFVPA